VCLFDVNVIIIFVIHFIYLCYLFIDLIVNCWLCSCR
jgi:hypothetical protein